MPAVESGKVCVFGANGAVGKVVHDALGDRYRLRLTDLRPIDPIEGPAKGGMPRWDRMPEEPHEFRLCDVTDLQQTRGAVEGCEAVINLAVNRSDPDIAFPVNVGGVFNILQASLEAGVKRVIHTGVWGRVNGFEGDYRYEYRLAEDLPSRAGTNLYFHSKSLGLDVANAFAEEEGLDMMTFLLSRLRPADELDGRDDDVMISYSVSFDDLGQAYLKGLQVPTLPRPNERFFICAPLPMDKYRPDKAERLLGWRARDTFERFWRNGEA